MKKKKIALMVMVTVLAGLSSFGFFRQTQAQIIDSFTFFIPFPADELDDHLDEGWDDPTRPPLMEISTTKTWYRPFPSLSYMTTPGSITTIGRMG